VKCNSTSVLVHGHKTTTVKVNPRRVLEFKRPQSNTREWVLAGATVLLPAQQCQLLSERTDNCGRAQVIMSNGSSNQVFTNTQKRITHPENGWKQIVDRTKSTEYENEQVCDSGWIHRDTNILIEKQETKQIRIYTDNRETEDMSTSNDTRQKMSAEEYNKILTTYAKATENTRVTVSDPTKHLLNLKKHYQSHTRMGESSTLSH
jgi:hypothetical protein